MKNNKKLFYYGDKDQVEFLGRIDLGEEGCFYYFC